MSGRLVSAVFDSGLPAWLKHYAAACASFALDDGSRVFPSMARLARMAGRSERATVTAVHELVRRGILIIETAHTPRRPARYRFNIAALPYLSEPSQLPLFPQATATKTRVIAPGAASFPQFPQASTGRGEAHFTPGVKPTSPDPSVIRRTSTPQEHTRARKGECPKTGTDDGR